MERARSHRGCPYSSCDNMYGKKTQMFSPCMIGEQKADHFGQLFVVSVMNSSFLTSVFNNNVFPKRRWHSSVIFCIANVLEEAAMVTVACLVPRFCSQNTQSTTYLENFTKSFLSVFRNALSMKLLEIFDRL